MAADLTCERCNFFRQRLVLATLSDKSVKMKNMKAVEDDPGLKGASVIELSIELLTSAVHKIWFVFCRLL